METESVEIRFVGDGVVLQTRERFASSVGVPLSVVQGWAEKGYLPMKKMGKYSLVDVAAIRFASLRSVEQRA